MQSHSPVSTTTNEFSVAYDDRLSFINPYYVLYHIECAYRAIIQVPVNSVRPVPPPRFCPACGQEATSVGSEWKNQDIFELMALDRNLDRNIVKAIYDLWEPADGDPYSFATFLDNSIKAASGA